MLSNEATGLAPRFAKTTTPRVVTGQGDPRAARHVAQVRALDRSTSSRHSLLGQAVHWGWQETTTESLFR